MISTQTGPIASVAGCRGDQRARAAALYWAAFGAKLTKVMGPDGRALAFLERVIDPGFALSAVDRQGRLLGIAGFKTARGALIGGTFGDLAAIYGRLGALWRAPVLSLLERPVTSDVLLMDGICVDPAARGRGIGTLLLRAIKAEAAARGLSQIRLDVIDTNPRARALYERQGFTATQCDDIGPLRHIFGFRQSTTMVCAL